MLSVETAEKRILLIRGTRVMLDSDLASLYRVSTKRLNEQVKRNRARFPADFMFRLSAEEKAEVVANCDHLVGLKYSPSRPYAFTEHGAVMLASVLNSAVAVKASIQVVRAFVRVRGILSAHKELAERLNALEAKCDAQFQVFFEALRQAPEPPLPRPSRRIGFAFEEPKMLAREQTSGA
jgi:hypothetical protein